jgi:hypothetical protein
MQSAQYCLRQRLFLHANKVCDRSPCASDGARHWRGHPLRKIRPHVTVALTVPSSVPAARVLGILVTRREFPSLAAFCVTGDRLGRRRFLAGPAIPTSRARSQLVSTIEFASPANRRVIPLAHLRSILALLVCAPVQRAPPIPVPHHEGGTLNDPLPWAVGKAARFSFVRHTFLRSVGRAATQTQGCVQFSLVPPGAPFCFP